MGLQEFVCERSVRRSATKHILLVPGKSVAKPPLPPESVEEWKQEMEEDGNKHKRRGSGRWRRSETRRPRKMQRGMRILRPPSHRLHARRVWKTFRVPCTNSSSWMRV